MTQTLAILVDSYRELNSRKLFWITLVISGVIVAIFALLGINEKGLTFVTWQLPMPLNTSIMSREVFYKTMFVSFGIGFWLAWLATILALVSTAGIFPELVTSGSIDLMLSKPLGRTRLFLTKYAGGLLFVALQVSVFSIASYLVLGFRGQTWQPAIFLAIPVIVIFFSYLFSICVLLGLLTRSTIAALLLTLVLWFAIFIVHNAEAGTLAFKLAFEQRVTALDAAAARDDRAQNEHPAGVEAPPPDEAAAARGEAKRAELRSARSTLKLARTLHRAAIALKTILPKTSETVGLLERWMIDLAELPEPPKDDNAAQQAAAMGLDPHKLQQQLIEELRGRSVTWVIGTSLVFEALVLALAGWRFGRRDF